MKVSKMAWLGSPTRTQLPFGSGQQAQDLLLQLAGILGLVFEDVRPAVAQPLEELGVVLEQVDRQADQVVEIHRAAIGQGALVIAVDCQPHLGQGQRSRRLRPAGAAISPGSGGYPWRSG